MLDIETIEQLCAIIGEMSVIIKDQAVFIEEQIAVDDAIKSVFELRRCSVDDKLVEIRKRTSLPISQ